jgi:hypothetical protein
MVEIPFTKRVRKPLVAENRAQKQHVLPDSGWVSFFVREDSDVDHAVWLLRRSYLTKRLSRAGSVEERKEQQQMLMELNLTRELSSRVFRRVNAKKLGSDPPSRYGAAGRS